MKANAVPLLTSGRIAAELGVRLPRVLYVLATRPNICPRARAGTLRLYDRDAVAMIRHEMNAIDARRRGQTIKRLIAQSNGRLKRASDLPSTRQEVSRHAK